MAADKQDAKAVAKEKDEAPAPPARIPVKALAVGFYGGARRRRGDEFSVATEKELGTWMERRDTPAAKALDDAAAARRQDEEKFAK